MHQKNLAVFRVLDAFTLKKMQPGHSERSEESPALCWKIKTRHAVCWVYPVP